MRVSSSGVVVAAVLGLWGCGAVTPLGADGGGGQGGSGSAGSGSAGAGSAGTGSGQAGSGSAGTGSGQGGTAGPLDAGVEAPPPDAGNPCRGLTEPVCRAKAGCAAGMCSGCTGGPSFAGCYQPATEAPPPCPGFACPPLCQGLSQQACAARSDCRVDTCPGCQTPTFTRCAQLNDPQPICPAIACVQPCSQVTTLAACETRPDCHSVYEDPRTCGCAAIGCCAKFARCADADKAICAAMPTCRVATPYCEGDFVVSYTANCFEGCVRKKDCAP